jgi:phenylpropionate dioxygenase-like ring-hydroxylating dioxygenase large terminal subunit
VGAANLARETAETTDLRKEWLCLGHTAMVAKVGDYFSSDVAGEPIVVIRGEDRIRALSSVCLHRWAPLVQGSGNTRRLSCPFHMWTYGLDGQLLAAPYMDEAADFQRRDCKLPEFRTAIIDGLIFVSLTNRDDAPALPGPATLGLLASDAVAFVSAEQASVPSIAAFHAWTQPEATQIHRNCRYSVVADDAILDIALPTNSGDFTVKRITLRQRCEEPAG